MTPTEQDKKLRALLGEMPGFVIDWLELSDELRNEWKKGGKASDFGGHRTFIQKYEKKLADFITADRKRVELETRVDELEKFVNTTNRSLSVKKLRDRLSALKAQQEEV